MSKFLRAAVPWLIVAALFVTCVLLIVCRKPVVVKPPAVATVTDTTWLTESTFTVHYKPDPAASKELAALRAELDGEKWLTKTLFSQTEVLLQQNQYLADSLTRLTLDSLRGIVRVERGPAGIAVVSYHDGMVQRFSEKVWRQRWTLLAGEEKPTVKTSRLPVDCGLFAAGGFATCADTWTPAPYVWAGLSVTRQCLTATVGPMFDGQIKLRGEVTALWRF